MSSRGISGFFSVMNVTGVAYLTVLKDIVPIINILFSGGLVLST
jgi:hypothetical protein